MEVNINGDDHQGYYIAIYVDRLEDFTWASLATSGRNFIVDHNISEILHFSSVDEYRNLGVKYGGFLSNDGLHFNNEEDINKFINSDEFTSHVVMAKLKS